MEESVDNATSTSSVDRYTVYYRDLQKRRNQRYQKKLRATGSSFCTHNLFSQFHPSVEESIRTTDAQAVTTDNSLASAFLDSVSQTEELDHDDGDQDIDGLSNPDSDSERDSPVEHSSDEDGSLIESTDTQCPAVLHRLVDFIHAANLNKTTTSALLSLLRSAKFENNLPSSTDQLWEQLGIQFHYDVFIYCSTCMEQLNAFRDQCLNCGTPNRKPNSELIVFSISDELRRIVESNIELIKWYALPQNRIVADIVQGNIYRQQNSPHPSLTLMLSTDGKPMINSKATRTSVWPVMGFLVEIPPSIREHFNNLMLMGLWHSPVSPPTDLLLTKIVRSIKTLTSTGIDIFIGKKLNHFSVHVQLMSGDLPARAKCNKLTNHNGYFACSRCLMEGKRCPSPCKRHTLYRWVDFRRVPCRRRTQEHMNQCAQIADLRKKPSYGVLGLSPLATILSVPEQSTFDYFHLSLEIHLRTVMGEWYRMIKDYPGAVVFVDNFLNGIKYPHSFNRHPRDFANYGKWKASQLRTFLLYIALPLLIRLRLNMPHCFPEVYVYHFSLFLIYVRTLRHFSDRTQISDMPPFIDAYLNSFTSFYANCKELYSTHALCHLWEQVEDHGGLAYHSLFASESCLHHIGKLAHGTFSLGQQIAFWWSIYGQMNAKKKKYRPTLFTEENLVVDSFFDSIVLQSYRQEFELVYNQMFGEFPTSSMKFFSRYKRGLILYHSLSYSRRKRCASYNVCVETANHHGEPIRSYGQILFFMYVNNQPFFLFKQFFQTTNAFSSLVRPMENIPKWNFYLDQYYPIVRHSASKIIIYPCSFIASKCIVLPLDAEFSVCTPIELETEHD